jgi:two-component system chemotaxis response regulator CheB
VSSLKKIRVLVVDDSATMQSAIIRALSQDPAIKVVGTAGNGKEAIDKCGIFSPDVITMDLNMPVMDGIEATRQIIEKYKTPIVVISAHANEKQSALKVIDAMFYGAIETVQKPSGEVSLNLHLIAAELASKVKIAAASQKRAIRSIGSRMEPVSTQGTPSAEQMINISSPAHQAKDCITMKIMVSNKLEIVGVGASTGGPAAIMEMLENLRDCFQIPVVVVIHMEQAFLSSFVQTVEQRLTSRKVEIATDRGAIKSGHIYLAPDNYHLEVKHTSGGLFFKTNSDAKVQGFRPSVNVLFSSIARVMGKNAAGVVMTGMGKDGAEGLLEMKKSGAVTMVQSEASSVIYGMPKAAIEIGAAMQQHSPVGIAEVLNAMVAMK